ncbi:hypothetical protein XaC1_491 [Xanthomonas phage XaC1]|nr:hypothetical protein XaC1_491 [Xanthomonas phage XaC1]
MKILFEVLKHLIVLFLWAGLWLGLVHYIPDEFAKMHPTWSLLIVMSTFPNLYIVYSVLKPYNKLLVKHESTKNCL